MQTAIYISLLLLGIFIYARICRDHRVYSKLLFCSIVAFLIGSCIKSKSFDTNLNQEEVITTPIPTNSTIDSTVVWIDSIDKLDLGKVEESDIVIPTPEYNEEKTRINVTKKGTIMRRNNIGIQNDS